MLKLIALVSLVATHVAAHGYVQELTLGSEKYTGYLPYSDNLQDPPPARIIRKIPDFMPITDLTRIDLQCGGSPTFETAPAPLVGKIAAGETVHLNWTAWPDNHKGPVLTYLARPPAGVDITEWVPGTDAVWFKIDQFGKEDGKWAAADKLTADSGVWSVKIPENLLPGQYILRNEIIDLHSAAQYPGIQFFPSCAQIEVTGSGTAFPTEFVSIPGVYEPDTPGIVWDIGVEGDYTSPGPAVWTGVA
ncbi:glycoside hydrolase family 61 protein F [Coprinellus micaceus]|uniref:lytic cellulose monooxygenase (C4-dehydrogenating) n=1 Tax=Coprinellus micaceus TaxID=71717 RepID=A0A4Y7T2J2_COPMI|nr:glycoside hydrolase family 61 protein F [Coprinellus micaceus]